MGAGGNQQIDAHELRRLIESQGPALALYARQWGRDSDDAVQEAFIELARLSPPPREPAAWLFVTVRRRAMNQARAEQRRAEHHRRAGQLQRAWFEDDDESGLEAREVEALLAELPALEREIVVARIWGELSFEQIAALVEKSTSAVHRRYQAALSILGQRINGKLNESR